MNTQLLLIVPLILLTASCGLLLLKNHNLSQQLKRLLIAEDNTGLASRESSIAQLSTLFASAKRYKLPLTVALVKISNFDQVQAGIEHDPMLPLAHLVHRELRSSDLIGRYELDTVILVLSHTNSHDARVVFERLIEQTSNLPNQPQCLLGCAHITLDATTDVALRDQAEQALAKASSDTQIVYFN